MSAGTCDVRYDGELPEYSDLRCQEAPEHDGNHSSPYTDVDGDVDVIEWGWVAPDGTVDRP